MAHAKKDCEDDIFGVQKYEAAAGVHERFLKVKVTCQPTDIQPIENFSDVLEGKLYDQVRENVQKAGWLTPLPIQAYGIPALLLGKDLVGCGETGSGKTLAYLLPIVMLMIDRGEDELAPTGGIQKPVTIILGPTRELTEQIFKELLKLTDGTRVKPVNLYGGGSTTHERWLTKQEQTERLTDGSVYNVVVATTGRLWHFINNGLISLERCRYIVLDEADRMLQPAVKIEYYGDACMQGKNSQMGPEEYFRHSFLEEVRRLFQHNDLPPQANRQVIMITATFPHHIQTIAAAEFLTCKPRYTLIEVGLRGVVNRDVKQEVLLVNQGNKEKVLFAKLQQCQEEKASMKVLVFVETRAGSTWLANRIHRAKLDGISVLPMSGNLRQYKRDEPPLSNIDEISREETMERFRRAEVNVLVATNVAARGLDVPMVDHVINFDLPRHFSYHQDGYMFETDRLDRETYVHRVGRAGRLGNRGYATTLFDPYGPFYEHFEEDDKPRDRYVAVAKSLVGLLSDVDEVIPPFLLECAAGCSFGVFGRVTYDPDWEPEPEPEGKSDNEPDE